MNYQSEHLFKLTCLVIFVMSMILSNSAISQTPVSYTSFEGDTLTRYVYLGENVALLVDSPSYDADVMQQIVSTFDTADAHYKQVTGREPSLHFQHQGKATIAQVPSTCGAGCGFLGATGIEIRDHWWNLLYDGVKERDEFDQVVFYELGRNFWFYGSKIELVEPDARPITTGFAVAMRFESMDAAGINGGPFNGLDFEIFRSQVRSLVDLYTSDESLNFNNTIRIGQSPVGWGATDLFASFYLRLADEFGDTFRNEFWQRVGERPKRLTTEDAVDNVVIAASLAARRNLGPRFSDEWRWPVSQNAQDFLEGIFKPIFHDGFEASDSD